MNTKRESNVWVYRFAIEHEQGLLVGDEMPEALMNVIVAWAEENQLQIGGGYRLPNAEDAKIGCTPFVDRKMKRSSSALKKTGAFGNIKRESEVWMFRFALEQEQGLLVCEEMPESLLDIILSWAVENRLQVGGGYRVK